MRKKLKNPIVGTQYRPLTEDQVGDLHNESLKILTQLGLAFEPALVDFLGSIARAGIDIDPAGGRIRFSSDLVNQCLNQAPARVILYGRNGQRKLELCEDQVYFANGGTAVNVLDIDSGQCRKSTLDDFYDIVRLTDKLENLDMAFRTVTPQDVPLEISDVNLLYANLKGTNKHMNLGIFVQQNLPQILEIAAMAAGGKEQLVSRPWLSIHATGVASPLKLDTNPIRLMAQAVEYGLPVSLSTAPMAGSTGPVTLAGNLTLMHAELMAMIVIAQLLKPCAPVIYCSTPVTADMATMNFLAGTMESAMMMSAAHQLARHINVPNFVSAGWTDSKLPDIQAGWEAAATLLLAAMGGGNCIRHAAGILDSAMTAALEQYVISNEIIGLTKRVLQGFQTNKQHIAYDLIQAVGPGGEFITSPHTLEHMRTEMFAGHGVTNRQTRELWEAEGSVDARNAARTIAKKILAKPETPCISPEFDRWIRAKFEIRL